MAIFPRPARPKALLTDIKAFLRGEERHKILIALISILMPALLIAGFYVDSKRDKPPTQIVYIQNYNGERSDEEIIKQNVADQKILDAKRRAKQEEYQRLAKTLGIDY